LATKATKKNRRGSRKKRQSVHDTIRNEIIGILVMGLACLGFVMLYSNSKGAIVTLIIKALRIAAGDGSIGIFIILGVIGISLMSNNRKSMKSRTTGVILLWLVVEGFLHLGSSAAYDTVGLLELGKAGSGGGLLGAAISIMLVMLVGVTGGYVILAVLALIGAILAMNRSLVGTVKDLLSLTASFAQMVDRHIKDFLQVLVDGRQERQERKEDARNSMFPAGKKGEPVKSPAPDNYFDSRLGTPVIEIFGEERNKKNKPQPETDHYLINARTDDSAERRTGNLGDSAGGRETAAAPPGKLTGTPISRQTEKNEHYRLPPLNLVHKSMKKGQKSGKDIADNVRLLEDTLASFGVRVKVTRVTQGPTITRYEVQPAPGVKVSKITSLSDDIALSLSALGIRIIAPMPGKGTIGIEVPNKEPQIVSMQSVISSKKFQECTYDLPVALGKTITNEVFMFDLTKMPHLLVAGATGQGKSVGLNAIITSLLYKKHPAEMKMVLIDPKMVEFNIYSTIEKHYLAKLPDEEKAIITDVTKVTQTLNSLTQEMDDRYELLMRAHVRTIKEYNEKFVKRRLNPEKGHRYMPYIVVVIDEFGDLIMTAGKEIEMPIARIAQKARAVGIHMVIATQRPTTNIITGTIKANFPARMAFRVTSQIDSRTILDMSGANQLIGRGDMLFSQGSSLIRIQCAFVDTPEVEEIAQYIGKQNGYDNAFALPEVASEGDSAPGAVDLNDKDTLFEEAARLIVVHQQGSTSLIQRKFSIGYNRAGRLMDQLEAAGIVGAAQGSKPRDVFIADEYSLEKLLDSLR